MSDQTTPVEETLAWEAAHRRTASAGALVAGLGLLIGLVAQAAALGGAPQVALLTALRHANSIGRADLRVPQFAYISNHAPALLFAAVLQGGAYAAAMLAFGFLYRATRARRPALKRWVLPVLLIGLGLLAVATAVGGAGLAAKAHSFAHGSDHSHHAANQVLIDNTFTSASALMQFLAGVLFAVAIILLSLNAMRSGLLTRFMGTLGIVSGAAYVVLTGTALHVFPFIFWMIGIGILIGGHWPNGVPPAWASGQAEPWPTSQQVREQRDRARGGGSPSKSGRSAKPTSPAPDSIPAGVPSTPPHPSSKKRKRKRR